LNILVELLNAFDNLASSKQNTGHGVPADQSSWLESLSQSVSRIVESVVFRHTDDIRYRLTNVLNLSSVSVLGSERESASAAFDSHHTQAPPAVNNSQLSLTEISAATVPSVPQIVLFPSGSDAEFLPLLVALVRKYTLTHRKQGTEGGVSTTATATATAGVVFNFVVAAGEVCT
jgi:hypothetical protein